MKIFAISDLHLSGSNPKPMDIFGSHWQGHWDKIKASWQSKVRPEDIVLIPGDISWAMNLGEAIMDLNEIGAMPGRKILMKGNHDYWWSSISRVRNALPTNMYAIQNDYLELDGLVFCGTRGWTAPGGKDYTEHDQKIFERELNRLILSLKDIPMDKEIIMIFHYPPFDDRGKKTKIMDIIEGYPIKHILFGHLHGDSLNNVTEGLIDGINYHLVSCDYLNFELKLIMEV
ncbi:MAG: metallophosphoesterase [Xylanivirga thermophila]|jgi:uncharacterized protein|uniref:metallophosphoesterase n=1 Tax=Xylanivirga thermophila TaxID=2496273 RepID=UPI0039F639D3